MELQLRQGAGPLLDEQLEELKLLQRKVAPLTADCQLARAGVEQAASE